MGLICCHRSSKPTAVIRGQPVFGCSHPKNRTGRAMIQRVAGVAAIQCMGCPLVDNVIIESSAGHPQHIIRITREDLRSEDGWQWVSAERMMRDVRELLLPKLPQDLAGIAGVPRSAMVPAAYLATLLHLPLYQACPKRGLTRLDHQGSRSRAYGWGRELGQRVLVLEDSTFGGGSLAKLKRAVPGAVFAAVYHRPKSNVVPDYFARELEAPHWFEWHWVNSGIMNGATAHPELQQGAVLDMDGIVCHDPRIGNGPEYESWLPVAPPRHVPRVLPCRAILTARLEKHREATMDWLARHHARYSELVMATTQENVAEWKAQELRRLAPSVYVESSPRLAREIHELWGGVVICPPADLVLRRRG